jgi:hypothetical protein
MSRHAHPGTVSEPSSLQGYAVTPKVWSSGVLGIGVRTCCARGRAGLCGASSAPRYRRHSAGPDEAGSAVLAANLDMTCLGSPATLGGHRPTSRNALASGILARRRHTWDRCGPDH